VTLAAASGRAADSAEACESVKGWPPEDPFLLEAYTSGDVLRRADPPPGEARAHHTIEILPSIPNAKEGTSFFHMTGYDVVR
jgi:hypothetical protein